MPNNTRAPIRDWSDAELAWQAPTLLGISIDALDLGDLSMASDSLSRSVEAVHERIARLIGDSREAWLCMAELAGDSDATRLFQAMANHRCPHCTE